MYSSEQYARRYNLESLAIPNGYSLSYTPLKLNIGPYAKTFEDIWFNAWPPLPIHNALALTHSSFGKNAYMLDTVDPMFLPNDSLLNVYNELLILKNLASPKQSTLPQRSGIDLLVYHQYSTLKFHFKSMSEFLKGMQKNKDNFSQRMGFITFTPDTDSPIKFEEIGTCLLKPINNQIHIEVRSLVLNDKGSGITHIGAQRLLATPNNTNST